MKKIFTFIFLSIICQIEGQPLQQGNFIFVSSSTLDSDFEQSIVAVTQGKESTPGFSHVGMIVIENGDTLVLEATPEDGVVLTNWDRFTEKNIDTRFYMGVLKKKYLPLIPNALEKAKLLLGKKYDFAFDLNNDTYYCSELIYKIFEDTELCFPTPPMTFKKDGSDEFLPFWIEYYHKRNLPIPEGELGLNPTGMSRSNFFAELEKYMPTKNVAVKVTKIEFKSEYLSYFIFADEVATKNKLLIISPVSRYAPSETRKPVKKGEEYLLELEYIERRYLIIGNYTYGTTHQVFGKDIYVRRNKKNKKLFEVVIAHNLYGGYYEVSEQD